LDGIIYNAGVGLYAEFEKTQEEDIRELFEINFFSILHLTQGLLPLLKLGEQPTLLFVSSVIGWRAIPRITAYCASKAALNLFAESLRIELEKYSIKVVTAYPGRTKTEFSTQAKSIGWRPSATKYGMSPEKVAKKLIRAYQKGKRDEYVSLGNRLMIWMNFIFSKLLDRALRKYFKNK
jgi:short-subunit dehydrogenase